jgi:hypothetical protein
VLGYEPAIQHHDGEFHDIRVRVNRRDVTVRARRGYYAPEPDAARPPVSPELAGISPEAREALRLPSSTGDLGIDLFAAPFKGVDGQGSVVLGAHLRGADLVLGRGEPIEIGYQAMTTEGTRTPGKFHVLALDFTPESRAAIERTGVRFIDRLALPRGRHQVRFAVHQPNGKTGSVVADVEIPDYADEPLLLSGVLLASAQTAADRTLLGTDRLRAILGSDPTPRRRFSRDDTVTAYAEVYTTDRAAREPLDVTATLTSVDGATARGVPTTRGDDVEAAGYTARFALADLVPGDYVLTIQAQAGEDTAERRVLLTIE